MGNLKCATDPKQTFLDFGLAGDATIYPGRAVKETTAYDGVTKTWVLAVTEADSIAGVAAGLATGGGDVNNYTAGQPIQVYKMGSEAVVMLSGNVTDRTIPLVIDAAGKFTPATTSTQTFNAIARELGSSGEYITVLLCTGKWVI
jgi:hypothetical protein